MKKGITMANKTYQGNHVHNFIQNFVAVDIETTGLDPVHDNIIEVGCAKYRNNKLIDTFNMLIQPPRTEQGTYIPKYITSITGITDSMVSDCPQVEDVISEFIDFIQDDVLVGHNVKFDIRFLFNNCIQTHNHILSNDYADTLYISRKLMPELEHHRLNDITASLEIENKNYHRALADAIAAAQCYIKLSEYEATNEHTDK